MNRAYPKDSISSTTGMSLLLTLGTTYVIQAILLFAGVDLPWLSLPLGLLISQVVISREAAVNTYWKSLFWTLAIWAIAILICYNLADCSYDGNDYHQEMVQAVASGEWNPYRQFIVDNCDYSLWTLTYAKGIEILAGTVISLTGSLESGKSINLILIISTGLICWDVLRNNFEQLSLKNRIIIMILLIGNPVLLSQCLTYQNDFPIYCYIILTLALSNKLLKGQDVTMGYAGLATVILLAVATKFTSFFFEGLTILCILIAFFIHREYRFAKKYLLFTSSVAVISAFFICFHPYITNWISYGHPLYPLMGTGAVDIMSHNTHDIYCGHNRFYNFFQAYSAFVLYSPGLHRGGFGCLFAIILPLSFLIIV